MADRARVAVLISGRGSNMAALIYAAKHADCPFEIVLVAANEPEAAGLAIARAEGIPIFAHSHTGMKREDFDTLIDGAIRAARADFVALAGYMRLLSSWFIAEWRDRIVNIHPSLLPAHKGLDTHGQVLAAGERVTGCTVHVVTEALDDGPILGRTEVAVIDGDTTDSLAARVLIAEHQLYSRCLGDYVTRERDPTYLLGRVRELAMAQSGAEETQSHGMPCFGIAKGKKFAWINIDHHGDGRTALLTKISGAEEQAALIAADPARYYRPAYFGDGWIAMRLDLGDTDWAHVADWIKRSWRAVAPKRLTAMMDAADAF